VKIILASLSSVEFGKLLNEYLKGKYGFSFDGVIGTVMKFDEEGKLIGLPANQKFPQLVGDVLEGLMEKNKQGAYDFVGF